MSKPNKGFTRYTLVKQPLKVVAHYSLVMPGDFRILKRVYPFIAETEKMVQVRHWYGKRWHPKNDYWKVEILK